MSVVWPSGESQGKWPAADSGEQVDLGIGFDFIGFHLLYVALVNIAGVVTLVPITGITLPYISQGGSSHWVTSLQFGLLLGLSEMPPPKKKKKKGGGKR